MTKTSVHYIKSNNFIDAPLDGTYVGTTSEGKVVLCPYSERMAIPQEMIVEGEDGDSLGLDAIKEVKGKTGMVRSMHGAFYLDINGVKNLIKSLNGVIETYEKETK